MTLLADTPTLGLLTGVPVAILLTLGCLFVLTIAIIGQRKEGGFGGLIAGTVATLLVVVGIACFALWPFKHDYHFWVPKGGTVTEVDKRLVPAGDSGMEEKFVLTIDGQPYGVTDTRAATVRKGDRVDIACKRAYEWGSTNHGWDCRWNGMEGR
jgi:hypothetical protein